MVKVRGEFPSRNHAPWVGGWQGAKKNGGAEGNRTPDLVIANDALSQLSYGPVPVHIRKAGQPRESAPLSEEAQRLKEEF